LIHAEKTELQTTTAEQLAANVAKIRSGITPLCNVPTRWQCRIEHLALSWGLGRVVALHHPSSALQIAPALRRGLAPLFLR
jgi:hypothetical protein